MLAEVDSVHKVTVIPRGRALGVTNLAAGVAAGGQGAGEDVVGVGGDHDPVDGQAHPRGHMAGVGVAEIARGHDEPDRPLRAAQG